MDYVCHLLIYFAIYSIVAMSLNIIVGYCGLITMAHAGFFAIGGYTCAIAMLKLHWSFLPALFLSIIISSLSSFFVSLFAKRLKGDFFVLLTLAVQVVIYSLIYNWSKAGEDIGTLKNLTNGPFGISNIPKPNFGEYSIVAIPQIALLAITLTIICSCFVWLILKSPWGRLLKCMRDDELALRSLGRNTHILTIQAFTASCALASIAGSIYATYVGYIDPSMASLNESILVLSMVIIGGIGNFKGPILGAILLIAIPEILRMLHLSDIIAANVRLMIYGILMVLMMHFRPQGIAGEYRIK